MDRGSTPLISTTGKTMKKFLLILCLSLLACEKEKPTPAPPPPAPCPEPVVIPTSTNPFEKPPPPPPVPVREPFKAPHWVMVGEFKMNDNWSIWTWRDDANHNTCYFYNILVNGAVTGHGVSCVKE